MTAPQVSVILPAYNQEAYIGAAIQSVLDQTYAGWELIVVDDGSTDGTAGVVQGYSDPRIRYCRQENRGLPGARNTGIRSAAGSYLAFLDADDSYHPAKLEAQLSHLERHPEVGLSYASRIEVFGDGTSSWFLLAPPQVTLADLVLGFPFTVNDILLRKTCVDEVGLFDESFRLHSEDRNFYLRLALHGCQLARCNRMVAYRRVHTRRNFDRIQERIDTMLRALDTAFNDPRCPPEVIALRDRAYAKDYLAWGLQELVQGEVEAGQAHIRTALRLNPSIAGAASELPSYLVWFSLRDGGDHVETLEKVFAGLPEELSGLRSKQEWAVGQGHLVRGGRAMLWGYETMGEENFARAARVGALIDQHTLQIFADQLASFEQECGTPAAGQALERLLRGFAGFATPSQLRWFESYCAVNQAFADFGRGRRQAVPGSVLRAARLEPARLADRGVLSILARSLISMARRAAKKTIHPAQFQEGKAGRV